MILRRLGSKKMIAEKIIPYFPEHNIYIEPFFGVGGLFFNKPKAKNNLLNDLDSDVFNFFIVIQNRKDEFLKAYYQMPVHSDLLNYWKLNLEIEPIKKALRFVFLSNFTYLGHGDTIRMGVTDNSKKQLYLNIDKTFELINNCIFSNFDFRKFFNSLIFKESEKNRTFIYCDPPYLLTGNNYSNSFTENDSIDLFNCLEKIQCKWAMSEFDNEFILNQAKERNLNITIIGDRSNLKNRRKEILITNYLKNNTLF